MNYPQEDIKPYNQEEEKGKQVERMFDNIAPDYDTLNHTMSLGIDKWWRRTAINRLKRFAPKRMLDVATGTGDFAILACRKLSPDSLVGIDISEGMMNVGRKKVEKAALSDKISFVRDDCTSLSFQEGTFDAITVAFGIRNFADLDKGLAEMCRVMSKGGHLVILELTTPESFPMKQLFAIYSKLVIPAMGRIMSKDKTAYSYLPQTIKAFPQGEVMKRALIKAGFAEAEYRKLTFGICTLYTATK